MYILKYTSLANLYTYIIVCSYDVIGFSYMCSIRVYYAYMCICLNNHIPITVMYRFVTDFKELSEALV